MYDSGRDNGRPFNDEIAVGEVLCSPCFAIAPELRCKSIAIAV